MSCGTYLLEPPDDRIGIEHAVTIGSQRRKRVDLKALADEIGASLLQRFISFRTCMVVRLQEREVELAGKAGRH